MKANGRYLLDTSIIIDLLAGDQEVCQRVALLNTLFVPSISLGELYYGAFKSQRVMENLERLEEFVRENSIIPCDARTAKIYGEMKNALRSKGSLIPENDIWIAAIAVQHGLTLLTRDAHFRQIDYLIAEYM